MTPAERAQIDAMHDRLVRDTLRYLDEPAAILSASNAPAPILNGATTAGITMESLRATMAKLTRPPEPLYAIEATLGQFWEACRKAGASEASPGPAWPFLSPLYGLDVVEEAGWVYVGTTKQIADAIKRFGSLSAARMASKGLAPTVDELTKDAGIRNVS